MPQSLSLINVDRKNSWFLNSSATNHSISSSENFVSYIPYASNIKIRIADGSLTLISGKGQIFPLERLFLQNVLHLPNISYNLLL